MLLYCRECGREGDAHEFTWLNPEPGKTFVLACPACKSRDVQKDAGIRREVEGGRPDCLHKACEDTGRGCSAFFKRCLSCGAKLSYFTGTDHFLAAAEAAAEPPDDWSE